MPDNLCCVLLEKNVGKWSIFPGGYGRKIGINSTGSFCNGQIWVSRVRAFQHELGFKS